MVKIFWFVVPLAAIVIGFYPTIYLLVDMNSNGLLADKGVLTESNIYMAGFYLHIFGGGVALLTGWPQFKQKFRTNHLDLHRALGKIYIIVILIISAPAGLYLARYADGGLTSTMGFASLAILWWSFTLFAYKRIREGNLHEHKFWMIRSYALTFAAVTLRIWLPVFSSLFGYDAAYPMISWFCWVPNMIFAELIIRKNWVWG